MRTALVAPFIDGDEETGCFWYEVFRDGESVGHVMTSPDVIEVLHGG